MKDKQNLGHWCRAFLFGLSFLSTASVHAQVGHSFTIVANEENTKDMSVNLVADTLRDNRIGKDGRYDPIIFGNRKIRPPTLGIPKEAAINLVNHDTGILDIQHTFLSSAPLASRVLISFESLEDELKNHCWTKEDAPSLKATLRLYVIPPYGPGKHNRLIGVAPSAHFPPAVGLDPPPFSVPIGVFIQQESWTEGAGQNSFFTATYDPEHLLDVSRVGIAGPGTVWAGEPVEPVDLCLNREPGRVAEGRDNRRATLCYDDNPDWQPWMEWDVTRAVQQWMREGFDPARYHGFSLYQYPGVTVKDQVRAAPEEPAKARTRAVVSFASSSAKADCPGVGGLFGGPSQAEIVFGNMHCMSADPADTVDKVLKLGDPPTRIPRILEMKTHPEWRPQLVITATAPSRDCSARVDVAPEKTDLSAQGPRAIAASVAPVRPEDSLRIQSVDIKGSPGLEIKRLGAGCKGAFVSQAAPCAEQLAVKGSQPGSGHLEVVFNYLLNDESAPIRSIVHRKELSISEDFDGTPDAVENLVPNQDANEDGIPDRKQSEVNSVQDPRGGWLSVITPRGLLVEELRFPELVSDDSLGAVNFKRGFIGFRIKGVQPGQGTRVQIRSSNAFVAEESFFVYGPEPKNFKTHWFALGNHGDYGSLVREGKLDLLLHDGAIGDIDGVANGEIVVLGGVGTAVGASKKPIRLTDATVASSNWLMILLLGGVAAVVGGFAGRSRGARR